VKQVIDPKDMTQFVLSTEPASIVLISWIVSEYDGIGFIRTDDPQKGIISLFSPQERTKEAHLLVKKLSEEGIPVKIEEIVEYEKREEDQEE
jgi:hypothetical protein